MTSPSTTTTTTSSSTAVTSGAATPAALTHAHVISQATVEALGDWLLESASVQSVPAAQEQRRRQSYKSSSLINKSLRQSQEERRKIALAEQAKKRYQFTNHARKLALFASGQPSEESSDSEDDNEDNEDDEDGEEEGDEADNNGDDDKDQEDDEDDDDQNPLGKKKKKKRSNKTASSPSSSPSGTGIDLGGKDSGGAAMMSLHKAPPLNHKRRLSSGSESEATAGKKKDKTIDALSPKKPRLQKNSPKAARKHKDRNPFRDQMMMPEPMTDIPTDLDTSYYIVPLPIGHRCFVISADGKTTARLPSGQLLVAAFESCLPAGSNQYRGNRRSDYCILDCVYSSVTRTFWTIDIMCWRGHPVYECETEFRFWWLRGKLAEIENLQGTWIASQTKEWEQEQAKKRQKKAKQLKRRQEKAAAAAAAAAMEAVSTENSSGTTQEECDDGDDEAGTEGMEVDPTQKGAGPSSTARRFWPIVFTPLPYFNASIDLVRLLAESMHQPTRPTTITTSPPMSHSPTTVQIVNNGAAGSMHSALALLESVSLSSASTSTKPTEQLASSAVPPPKRSTPATTFAIKTHPTSIPTSHTSSNGVKFNGAHTAYSSLHSSPITGTLGTMALSGEIATAASLFPAHDTKQKIRQDQTLLHERAAGLVFFNKKTMYVLGSTPLCGWVAMDQIGDIFFDDEGGIGPVPGTSAVEGREIEMEDALERIRI
ncbi:hypothetical protein BG015_008968 [Linnemannia schmuckeri]|uniref:Snurportin-1 n=1 Tax=Linnemannia schmuckeri TaxID=64567 RepID=A0A9P5RWP5_9FUNG|nr:hypothetical protein BG015_008968 [Linnemannia schmuckeri]